MDTAAEISRLVEESRILERRGKIAAAIQRAEGARQLAHGGADAEGEAQALNALVYAHIRLGHYEQARIFSRQVLGLAGAESPARVDALLNLGICAGETDDLATLELCIRQVVDLSRQIGYDRALVRGLHTLSCMVYMPRGQFGLSLSMDEEALKIIQTRNQPDLCWGPLLTMSYVLWVTGQHVRAHARLNELKQVVLPGSLADGYWHYIEANLALEAGRVDKARDLFAQTLSIAEANGIAENLFIARLGLSRLNRFLQDLPTALAWAGDALAIVQRSGYLHFQAQALIERSRAAWNLGDLAAAETDLRSAMAVLSPQHLDFDLAVASLLLAAVLNQQNHPDARLAWQEASARLVRGGFAFLADRERALAFPLIVQGLKSMDAGVAAASSGLLEHLQEVPPPALQIHTLGGWEMRAGGRLIDLQVLRKRRAGELLALLLISRGRCLPTDQIVDRLWPDKEYSSALALLHQATSTLRRALEPDLPEKFPSRYLQVDDGRVALVLPPDSSVDYEVFRDCIRDADWDGALETYRGEFLPDYRYADWAEAQRRWLGQDYQRALLAKAGTWLVEGQFALVLDACRKLVAAEPWQEQAVLLGMQACMGLGDAAGALRFYQTLEKTLRTELGVKPQAELQELYCSLLKR